MTDAAISLESVVHFKCLRCGGWSEGTLNTDYKQAPPHGCADGQLGEQVEEWKRPEEAS